MSDVTGMPQVVVMGVSGAGKTTIGMALADELGIPFLDADELHSADNVAKMRAGIPLDDHDRAPWLEAVGRALQRYEATGAVIACSALRRRYREAIRSHAPAAMFLHLTSGRDVLGDRLWARVGHYMPVTLLDSQLEILEPLEAHERGVVVDANRPVAEVVAAAREAVIGGGFREGEGR